jgi:N-formylglutamate deformylase
LAKVQQRSDRCYRPYHAAPNQVIGTAYRRHGAARHLNVNSMPVNSCARYELTVKLLANFVLDDPDDRILSEKVAARVAETVLHDQGYSVARSDPLKGAENLARTGRPAERWRSLQIKVKRSCIADVERHALNDGFLWTHRGFGVVRAASAEHQRPRCQAH